MGRRKMAPAISPNKTVEGGLSGLLAGPAAAVTYTWLALPDVASDVGLGWLVALGLVLAGRGRRGRPAPACRAGASRCGPVASPLGGLGILLAGRRRR